MSRFLHGPRDNGPFNPPPWPQIVMAATGLVLCFVSGWIAYHYEWIGDVYVKGPCIGLCLIGFMFPIGFIGNGIDEARARGEWDDQEE